MVALETLLTNIATSVQTSQDAIQLNAYKNFLKYFSSQKEEDKQAHIPVTQYFDVSGSPESDRIAVPAVALVNHNSLVLDSVKVVLNVSGVSNGQQFMVSTEPINDSEQFDQHQITLEFKQKEPAEGISRILTAYNQFL